MAQHDQVIDNGAGAAVRADINAALAALFTQNSGATAPSVTTAYMLWADTTSGLLKMRNAANTAWVTLWALDAAPGNVAGPGVSVSGNVAIFSDTTGKVLSDAGFAPAGLSVANTFTNTNSFDSLLSILKAVSQPYQSLSDASGTITWNRDNGNAAKCVLTGTGRTLAMSGTLRAGSYKFWMQQDATGGRTITTWPWSWIGGAAPTFSTAANKIDIIGIESDGTTMLATASIGG